MTTQKGNSVSANQSNTSGDKIRATHFGKESQRHYPSLKSISLVFAAVIQMVVKLRREFGEILNSDDDLWKIIQRIIKHLIHD